MLPAAILLICGIGLSAVEASTERQETAAALQSIISNVAAAEFAAQAATGGRNTSSYYCGLSGQEDNLNKQGMNGTLGQLLTCELAVGVIVFPDPDASLIDLQATLAGLESLENHTSVPNLSRTCNLMTIATMEDAGLDGIGIWNLLCNTTASSVSPSVSSVLASISANLSSIAASAGFVPTSAAIKGTGTASSINISLPLPGSNRTLTLTPASGFLATGADNTMPSPLIFSSVNASAGISISTNGSFIAASSLLTAFSSPGSSPWSLSTNWTSTATGLPTSSPSPTPASTITSSVPITSFSVVGTSLSGSLTSAVVTTTSTGIATGNDGVLTETVVVWEYVTVFAKRV